MDHTYFLSGRTFQVSVGKSKSSVCNIPYGVPHGAVLALTLYNLFTSDAPSADGCELATFADDTAIFVSSSESMNVCDGPQLQLTDYFEQWKIKVNASKTQAIYFTRCWSPRRLPSTRIIFGDQIPGSDSRQETEICVPHGAKSTSSADRALRILYSFFNRKSKLCLYNKSCFICFLRHIVLFCVMGSKHGIIALPHIKRSFRLSRTNVSK
jgi:hypothetical protein